MNPWFLDWVHWAEMIGAGAAAGLVLAGVRCGLDYAGIWPMKYPP